MQGPISWHGGCECRFCGFAVQIAAGFVFLALALWSTAALALPPVAVDDFFQTISAIDSGNTECYAVTENDSDPDGDFFEPVAVTQITGGTPQIQSGSVCFARSVFFRGTASFGYTIEDTNGEQASATVTLEILNRGPTANDCSVTAESGVPLQFPVICDQYPDPELDPIEIISVGSPANGTALQIPGQSVAIEYVSNQGYTGPDSFTYTIQDSFGATSNGTISVDVTPFVNDAPVANDDTATTHSGPAAGAPVLINVLANDSDPDGDPLEYVNVIWSDPSNGTVGRQSGVLEYTPNAAFAGIDQFSYEVDDGRGATASAFVTVTVNPNQNPVVANESVQVNSWPAQIEIRVLDNDSDPDDDVLEYRNVSYGDPAHGFIEVGCVGNCTPPTYTPDRGYIGPDSFTYEVDDGLGGITTGTVTINVVASAGGPTAVPDSVSTQQEVPIDIDVLANDVSGDASELNLIGGGTAPQNGTAQITGSNTIAYTPNAGFAGPDSFTYVVVNSSGSATGTVTIDVIGDNLSPIVGDDTASTTSGSAVVIDVLANDSDPEQSPLTISRIAQVPGGGTAVVAANGLSLTYTPNATFVGQDGFQYEVSDSQGGTALGAVTVTVTTNPPVAVDDLITTSVTTPINFDPLANDSDPDGDALTIGGVTSAANGTIVLESNGTLTYTPVSDFTGTDTFGYTAEDSHGAASNQATVTVTVVPGNAPPTAFNDTVSTELDTPVTIDVLANDTDPNGDPLFFGTISAPQNGSVVEDSGGTLTYTPNTGFEGQDNFTYTVFDSSEAESNAATVTINVAQPNTAPVAVDDAVVTQRDVPVTINVLANDSDPDGDPLTISDATSPANGTLTPLANGFTYTPAFGFTGTDQFSYSITDGRDGSASATVTVTVNAFQSQLPTAVITGVMALYPDTDGQPGEIVSASGASSTAIEGEIATYVWFVNDTEVLRGPESDVSLALSDGENTVALVVIDQGGLESEPVTQTVGVAVLSSNPNLTPNQKETAAALEDTCSSLAGASSLTPEQQQLLDTCRAIIVDADSSAEVASVLDALSGEQVTATQTSGIDFSTMQLTNIGSRIKALRAGASGISVAGLNIMHEGQHLPLEQLGGFVKALLDGDEDGAGGGASGDDEDGGLFDDRLGLFVNGNVMFGEKDDSTLEAGYDFDSIGITVGADYRFTDSMVAGFALGYGDSSSEFTQDRGELDSDGYSAAIFASFYDAVGYIDGIVSYGQSSFDALRRIAFTLGGTETVAEAKGDTDAATFGVGLGAGWDFTTGAFTIGPNVALSYIEVDVDGYTETGAGGYNLIYDDQTGKSFTVRAGVHTSYAFSGKWGVLTPQLRVEFVKELENESQLVGARFAADPGSAGFVLATDVPDEEYFVWGLGLAGVFANGLAAFIDYQTVSSLDLIESHDFTVGLRYQRAFR